MENVVHLVGSVEKSESKRSKVTKINKGRKTVYPNEKQEIVKAPDISKSNKQAGY